MEMQRAGRATAQDALFFERERQSVGPAADLHKRGMHVDVILIGVLLSRYAGTGYAGTGYDGTGYGGTGYAGMGAAWKRLHAGAQARRMMIPCCMCSLPQSDLAGPLPSVGDTAKRFLRLMPPGSAA